MPILLVSRFDWRNRVSRLIGYADLRGRDPTNTADLGGLWEHVDTPSINHFQILGFI
jgi:hypothetical protein